MGSTRVSSECAREDEGRTRPRKNDDWGGKYFCGGAFQPNLVSVVMAAA